MLQMGYSSALPQFLQGIKNRFRVLNATDLLDQLLSSEQRSSVKPSDLPAAFLPRFDFLPVLAR